MIIEAKVIPYYFFIMLSFIVGFGVNAIILSKRKIPFFYIAVTIIEEIMLTLLGAFFISSIMYKFKAFGGIASIGGALGLLCGVFIVSLIVPGYRKDILSAGACVIPLMYSISKLSCFFNGCCYGIEYSGPFHIVYRGTGESIPQGARLPIQLIETILFLMIFIVGIYIVLINKRKYGIVILVCMCGLTKFILDFFRESHTEVTFVSFNQWMCLGIIIGGLIISMVDRQREIHGSAKRIKEERVNTL